MSELTYKQGLAQLRLVLEAHKARGALKLSNINRDEVLARFQPIFDLENLPMLSVDDFNSFLPVENNKHWGPIYRQKTQITADMDLLRKTLIILLDESRPIRERLDQIRPSNGVPMVKGLSKAVLTPILLVMHPEKYGVWNNTSETGMKILKLWPEMPRGASFGTQYELIYQTLLRLRDDLETDLWILDELWWQVRTPERIPEELVPDGIIEDPIAGPRIGQDFGLERYLHQFIVDNWDKIEAFQDWLIYEKDDEVVGVEYDTRAIGRIDILAKHQTEPRWLVVELKRDQSNDATIGQVLRYMGWVKNNLASPDERISGLIISRGADNRLPYALEFTVGVDLMYYEVQFLLRKA